jgi:DNA-directed RNA polymerases I, II, and III subunit RPABC1
MERAYKTCLEMLKGRKYKIIEEKDEQILAEKPDKNKIIIFFADFPKFNVKNIQIYMSIMNTMNINHSIIVYKDTITSFTRKTIEKSSNEIIFELFAMEDLQYNIINHKLQPKFLRLSENDSKEIKEKYGTKFPIMRKNDPISCYFGYNKGDIIKIVRKSGYITYRIVK